MKNEEKDKVRKDLEEALNRGVGSKAARFALSVLGGLIPFAGGALGGYSDYWSEKENEAFQKVLQTWLKLQEEEIKEIGRTLFEVVSRIDMTEEKVFERLESPEYLSIVKKCFRDWSAAESEIKRKLIRNLLINASGNNITTDDVIKLFVEWIDKYSDLHFKVIGEIYDNQFISRYKIWLNLYGTTTRENSPQADLFKLVIHDLSVGHIIRQYRETDYYGNFKKAKPSKKRKTSLTSALDDEKQYVLTELGEQFVHYTMNEKVKKIE